MLATNRIAAAANRTPATRRTGRSSRSAPSVNGLEGGEQLGAGGHSLVECGIRSEERPGKRLRRHGKRAGKRRLLRSLVVKKHGREARPAELLGVVGERKPDLLLVIGLLLLGGALPEEDRRPIA